MIFSAGIRGLIMAALLASFAARAVIIEPPITWTGQGPNLHWTTGSNWEFNTPPANNGTAQIRFGQSNQRDVLVDASQSIKGATFDFTGTLGYGYYTLFGNPGSTLTIGAGGLSILGAATPTIALSGSTTSPQSGLSSFNYGSVYVDTSLGVVLGAAQTWTTTSSTSLMISGTISGSGELTLRGDGDFFLDGNNEHSGGTVLDSVDLTVGSATALGTGTVTVKGNTSLVGGNGGDLTLANAFTLSGTSLSVFGYDGFVKLAGAITLAANTTISNYGDALFLDGTIRETGGSRMLTFSGPGVTVLSGDNTVAGSYTGGTAVYDGAAIFRNQTAVPGNGALTSSLYGYMGIAFVPTQTIGTELTGTQPSAIHSVFLGKFDRDATYGVIGFDTDPNSTNTTTITEAIDLSGFNSYVRLGSATRATLAGTITPSATAGAGYRFGGGGGTLTVESQLTGANDLRVESLQGGELTLKVIRPTANTTGAWNTYTGVTEATNSAIVFGPGALSSGSTDGSFFLREGGYIGSHDASASAFIAKFATWTYTGVIGFDSTDPATQRIVSGVDLSVFKDPVGASTLTSGRTIALGTTSAATITGALTLPDTQTDYYFTGYKGGWLTVDSALSGARVVHLGSFWGEYPDFDPSDELRMSSVFLNGANTHTGGTKLHSGRLVLGHATALGTGPLTISYSYYKDTLPRLETLLTGNPTFANQIVVDDSFEIGGVNGFTLSGNITDGPSGSGTISKHGAFNLTLTGNNAGFTGDFEIHAGTLGFIGSNAAGSGVNWITFAPSGGTVSFAATANSTATPIIGGVETYYDNAKIQLGSGVTLKINQASGSTYAGSFEGQGALLKTNTGTLRLEKASTFTGGTTLSEGTIDYAKTGALGTGNVTLNGPTAQLLVEHGTTLNNAVAFGTGGGVLSGNGAFGSNVVLTPKSGIAPGHSLGSLAFNAGLTWNGGAYYNVELQDIAGGPGIGHDTITVTGALVFNASASSPFTLNLSSLTSTGASGNLANFVATNAYSWQIATTTGGILGFDPAAIVLNTTGFANVIGIGTFNVALSGNNLLLNFTPVPEPSTWALMIGGLGAVALTALRRRRR